MEFAQTLCGECGRSVALARDDAGTRLAAHRRADGTPCPGSADALDREGPPPLVDAKRRAMAVLDLLEHSLRRLTEAVADDGDQSDREAVSDARSYFNALRLSVADVGEPAAVEACGK